MEELSEQLSGQIAYNNTLLEQLQAVERQQLASQQGVQERQTALRQTQGELEHLRSEGASLRSELLNLQRHLGAAQDEGVRLRDENAALRGEVDAARREIARLRDEANAAREERSVWQDKHETMTRQINQLSSVQQTFQSDAQTRISELQVARDSALQELADLKRAHVELDREFSGARQAVGVLQANLDSHVKQLNAERARAGQAEARIAVLGTLCPCAASGCIDDDFAVCM